MVEQHGRIKTLAGGSHEIGEHEKYIPAEVDDETTGDDARDAPKSEAKLKGSAFHQSLTPGFGKVSVFDTHDKRPKRIRVLPDLTTQGTDEDRSGTNGLRTDLDAERVETYQ